ncbi:putative mitochondrial protein, partial [Mucuna pruriens]
MTDLGLISYFLGIEVIQQADRIFISQKKNSKPISTPVEEKLKLKRDSDERIIDLKYFKSLIESLRYLTTTILDIVFGIRLLSRFMEQPRACHLHRARKILRYIKCILIERIFYDNNSNIKLVGYIDSDWAGDSETKKARQ